MAPRINVSSLVIQRLSQLEEGASGQLLGAFISDKSISVFGISKQGNNLCDTGSKCNNIIPNLPAKLNICGFFNVISGEQIGKEVSNAVLQNIQHNPVVINFDSTSKNIYTFIYEENVLKKVEHSVVDDLNKNFIYLRLTAAIPICCELSLEGVKEAFNFVNGKVSNGFAAFHIDNSNIYILGDNSNDINGISPEAAIENLLNCVNQSNDNKYKNNIIILNVNLYLRGTNDETSPQLAPVIKYVKKIYKHADIQLPLDALTLAPRKIEMKNLYPILVESVCRNLELNEKCLLAQLKSDDEKSISLPETYHFFPFPCGHFITVVYSSKQTCEQLKNFRKNFHSQFLLPNDKPLFRRANAYDFSHLSGEQSGSLLLNPHEGLPGSGVPEGEPCFVQGTYAYHHYMQDKIDDSGWGCAYRSLQTIFSWFRFQGYTNRPIPTHKEIQQCLVKIGDKPASFIGSSQWIGSTEVSFVLDTLLGVTSRIVSVSSGEELTMKGGELSHHFKTQGTPIMIGGGVLAHTIIGVDYNRKTGDIKFLILDPHYTGGEDLKIIQSKGWCGWKGPDFWKKNAFYNMCLPLIPKCV